MELLVFHRITKKKKDNNIKFKLDAKQLPSGNEVKYLVAWRIS